MENSFTVPESIFTDINIDNYVVQYQGDIQEEISRYPGYYVTIINDLYAIISLPKNVEINVGEPYFSTVVYVKPAVMFTLEEISPIEASQAVFLQLNLPLNLTGRGVNVAIIDSGIDYLSEEFMKVNGETRIEAIWDQTIISNYVGADKPVPYGTLYSKSQIQSAIQAYREGRSPYEIVPSQDEIGHGTNMAGIIGGTGKNPRLKGIVSDCDFIVVKLIRDFSFENQFNIKIPVFNITTIFTALEFLYRYSRSNLKPMVIYFPLGSTLGSHKGNGILEQYIESICRNSGIAFVTGAGNERALGEHSSGSMTEVGQIRVMELDVSPEQNDLWVEIWVDVPNIMSLNIISPSGEDSGLVRPLVNTVETFTFLFEKTNIRVNYFLPEEISGDEFIRIRFYNIQEGIWQLRLTANSVSEGGYNAWIPQSGITVGGTRFIPADPYGTTTNPSNSDYIITIAAYNQNNNNILNYSGMAFLNFYINGIDVAAGGVNALTVAPGNRESIVNGTSVSAAIGAGACAMLFEWGIVNGNNPYMYSQTLKTYLARGTIKRSGDTYPNPQWGYGILNILVMFQNMI
ncbi:S8 family peptidase [Clostridium vincentii]|uniref:Subtilase family protein n=1 Tax=Clostridium vincentii TaxID=52704 RepID=A0A2T0BC22_9CLOT|nr:S8 family peptidase [Clostridium vincentii]PRR81446.1 Subtilase family protein [Clostridium vincentii]